MARSFPTLAWTALLLVLTCAWSEWALRQPQLHQHLPPPGVGGSYYPFDEKLYLLEQFSRQQGHVDCIFLGSSMTEASIDPAVFEAAYHRQSGQRLECFNFGVVIMTASTIHIAAAYLVDTYHPRLLIYGTSSRDMSIATSREPLERDFPQTPWARYQRGHFNLPGWMVEHLRAFRYLRSIPEFLQPSAFAGKNDSLLSFTDGFRPLAFFGKDAPLLNPARSQAIELPFEPSPEDVEGLGHFLALADSDTRLLVVEIPMFEGGGIFYRLPDDTLMTHQDLLNEQIGQPVRAAGVPFWTTGEYDLIPYWTNQNHLQVLSTHIFSEWLGLQVGEAVNQGLLRGDFPAALLANPPLDAPTLDTRLPQGMSAAVQDAYQHYAGDNFHLVPPGAVILEPSTGMYSREVALHSLDFLIENGVTVNHERREHLFRLRRVLEQARFADEMPLSAAQQQAIAQWRTTKDPAYLHQADVDYLLYTSLWFGWLTPEEIASLTDPTNYREIATWRNFPIGESVISLVQVTEAP